MSTFNELCGVVPVKDSVSADALVGTISEAIGADDQARFFPVGDVIVLCEDKTHIAHVDFGMIPPEGAAIDIVERAMVAMAPSVDLLGTPSWVEVEMVPGYNVGDAAMYRFIGGHLECSNAELRSNGDWFLVEADLVRQRLPKPDVVEDLELPDLTESDWMEIYYALETKAVLVERGQYGLDLRGDAWPVQLRSILKKIGPDGSNMLKATG